MRTVHWPHRLTLALAAALLIAANPPATAHDHGTLKLASKMFNAGDSLTIVGEKFAKRDEVTLILVGVKGRISFGDVPTDSAGAFRRVVLVPPAAAPGNYRLVAEAIDGDEVASIDVMVMAARGVMASMPPMPGMDHGTGKEGKGMEPTGKPLDLKRSQSTAVTATAIALIIACVSAGVWLLRGSRDSLTEEAS